LEYVRGRTRIEGTIAISCELSIVQFQHVVF
jgi:hypothetical protein